MFFYAKTPDPIAGIDIFRRAALIYPDDFMLNFDYARMLDGAGRTEEAARIYTRCVGIRPNVGGIWRSLGITLRKLGEYRGSIDALERSIELQPNHTPTLVDLWLTHAADGDFEGASDAYRRADARRDQQKEMTVLLARALPELDPATMTGQLEGAIEMLRAAREKWIDDAARIATVDKWIEACSRAIELRNQSLQLSGT
jgi:tetratricopeptide (TPR) repeat protein